MGNGSRFDFDQFISDRRTANSAMMASQRQGDRCFYMDCQRQSSGRYFSVMDPSQSTRPGHRPARPPPIVITSGGSATRSYEVMSFLGRGSFGKVVKCKDMETNRTVALKMVKDSAPEAKRELEILRRLQKMCDDPDEHNIVRCFHLFRNGGFYCMVFEKLHMSLRDFIYRYQSLSLGEIRPIVQQVATTLLMLKRAGIIHTDLKPENIMLVDHHRQPLRIKVIDFGCARTTAEAKCGDHIQTRWYRSPEILLGLPYTEAIDMWSLGCVAAELFLGAVLYPGWSEYHMMSFITETQGLPPPHLLQASTRTNLYFTRDLTGVRRLKTPVEASVHSGGTRVYSLCSLDEIKDIHLSTELSCAKDQHHFVDMLQKMLELDPRKRFDPEHLLHHPFVTMSSFVKTQRTTQLPERKRTYSEVSEPAESSPGRKRQKGTQE